MSHAFHVHDVHALSHKALLTKLAEPRLRFTEDSAEVRGDAWPSGPSFPYLNEVSPRPLAVTWEQGCFTVKILTGCCAETCLLARDLAAAVATLSGRRVTPESELALDVTRFVRNHGRPWADALSSELVEALVRIYRAGHEPMSISGVRRKLRLGPRLDAQLAREPEQLVSNFEALFRRLNYIDAEDVAIGSVITVAQESSQRQVRMAVYGGIPSLVPMGVDVVQLTDDGQLALTSAAFAELIGERGTWLGEDYLFLPALTGAPRIDVFSGTHTPPAPDGEYAQLLTRARPHALTDPFSVGSVNSEVSPLPALSTAERDALRMAPLSVFLHVAAADGKVDEREVALFKSKLLDLTGWSSMLMRVCAAECAGQLREFARTVSERLGVNVVLADTAAALARTQTSSEAQAFCADLVRLAEETAQVSNGLDLFGRAARSKREAIELVKVNLAGEPLRRRFDEQSWRLLAQAPMAVFVLCSQQQEGFHGDATGALERTTKLLLARSDACGALFRALLIAMVHALTSHTRTVIQRGATTALDDAVRLLDPSDPAHQELTRDLLRLSQLLASEMRIHKTPWWPARAASLEKQLLLRSS